MPRRYAIAQVDVFTERALAGNPLAVVLDARGLTDAEMQAVAREMNLSETTFVLPATRPDCAARVRIFTPAREVPFAGHPTVGTSWVLATRGHLAPGTARFSLEEGIGPVPVELEGDPGAPRFIWMQHGAARFEPEVTDRSALARALGLAPGDLLAGAPVLVASTGSPFLYVPLADRGAVDRAALDVPALLAALGDRPRVGVFVFAADSPPAASPARVYSRMFAPHTSGVPEDPATGSASGGLGAYLVAHGLVRGPGVARIVSEQGTRMGRQSFVHVTVERAGDRGVGAIRVGGSVVPVMEGWLSLG